MVKIYLIAGEASGDVLGAKLMGALNREFKNIQFMGIGGESMRKEGLNSLFNISALSVMGIFEVIPSIPKIMKLMNKLIKDIIQQQPDIVISIDSYSFSARIHKKLKKMNVPFPHVHIVAPQVWAWKKSRAKKIGKFIDHLYCLLPNEPDYFTPYGMKCSYVGHPIVENDYSKLDRKKSRRELGIPEDALVLSMLPGSRHNEIKYLLPIFMKVAEQLSKEYLNLYILVPTVQTVYKEIREQLARWPVPHRIIQGQENRYKAFCASDFALPASGTVSLELALAKVPHIIAYRVHPFTGWLAKKILKIKYVNLINILSNKEIIPELLQDNCTVHNILIALKKILAGQKQNTLPVLQKLGYQKEKSPTDKIAQSIKKILKDTK